VSELLPKSEAVGVLGISWAIEVSKAKFAYGCKAFWRKLSLPALFHLLDTSFYDGQPSWPLFSLLSKPHFCRVVLLATN
jgi:hypothetical protein